MRLAADKSPARPRQGCGKRCSLAMLGEGDPAPTDFNQVQHAPTCTRTSAGKPPAALRHLPATLRRTLFAGARWATTARRRASHYAIAARQGDKASANRLALHARPDAAASGCASVWQAAIALACVDGRAGSRDAGDAGSPDVRAGLGNGNSVPVRLVPEAAVSFLRRA
jgi:hypothetical protein